jgi:hypothetical protein
MSPLQTVYYPRYFLGWGTAASMIEIEVKPAFAGYLDAAITRLSYLFPRLRFSQCDIAISVSGDSLDHATITREVNFALYRERIYSETLPLRERMYKALLD